MKTRAAIYGRYSTDKQKVTSLEGQVLVSKKYGSENGLTIKPQHIFTDSERSSATLFNRPGYAAMMAAAERGEFDVVIVECLDRISRELHDLSHVFKHLTFLQIEIRTVHEGVADDVKVALRGLFGNMFRRDLADKVRREHLRILNTGLIPGSLGYGYRRDPNQKGIWLVDPVEAKIIVRVYKEYLAGASPRTIAAGLTADSIPTRRAGAWNHCHLIGGGTDRFGILSNPIYKGELVWNAAHRVISPKNGNKIRRQNDPKDILRAKVPDLQIIEATIWNAAQALRRKRSTNVFGEDGKRERVTPVTTRVEHPFVSLLRCGACGSAMHLSSTARGHRYAVCAAYGNHSACTNTLSYNLTKLELSIRAKMAERLGDREAFMAATAAYYEEWRNGTRKATDESTSLRKQVDRLTLKIQRIDVAIRDSDTPVEELIAARKPLVLERQNLQERLRIAKAESTVVELRPSAMKAFGKSLNEFQALLASNEPLGPDDRHIMSAFLDTIVIYPGNRRADVQFECHLRIGALIGGGVHIRSNSCDLVNTENTEQPISHAVFSLGRWHLAA